MSLERMNQRGQTMPFWAIGTLIVLVMLFFLANYVNAVAWQIRAQNAADSAASGALTVQTNVFNEYSTLLYAAAVDEYRVRALNAAILNTIYSRGCSTGVCDADYAQLVPEYNAAVNSYTKLTQLLQQANNVTQGGQNSDQAKALSQISSNWCSSPNDYACQFAITLLNAQSNTNGNSGSNQGFIGPGDNEVDVVACKNIPVFAGALLKLTNTSYQVVARSAAAVLSPATESFNPGTKINASTGHAYQPLESWATLGSNLAYYNVDFTNLTVNLNWYQAGPIKPYYGTIASTAYTCQ